MKEEYRVLTSVIISLIISTIITIATLIYLPIEYSVVLYVTNTLVLLVVGLVDKFIGSDQKSGLLWYALRWVFAIPILNLGVILWLPVISVVNLFEWKRD
jgi:hypothetical protein